jgi:hypothetical protein
LRTKTDVSFLVYLLKMWCAVEIREDGYPVQIPPPFLTGMVLQGRPYCQYHEEYAALGGRVVMEFDLQKGPAADWLPALFPEGSDIP